jgi:hypothetical protein
VFQLTSGAISQSLRRNSDQMPEPSWHRREVFETMKLQVLRTEINELGENCDTVGRFNFPLEYEHNQLISGLCAAARAHFRMSVNYDVRLD